MIERLARAIQYLPELPEDVQEEIADQIEMIVGLDPETGQPSRHGRDALSMAGAWADLPDDMEEVLLRWRREVPPTPPLDEQLASLDEVEGE